MTNVHIIFCRSRRYPTFFGIINPHLQVPRISRHLETVGCYRSNIPHPVQITTYPRADSYQHSSHHPAPYTSIHHVLCNPSQKFFFFALSFDMIATDMLTVSISMYSSEWPPFFSYFSSFQFMRV